MCFERLSILAPARVRQAQYFLGRNFPQQFPRLALTRRINPRPVLRSSAKVSSLALPNNSAALIACTAWINSRFCACCSAEAETGAGAEVCEAVCQGAMSIPIVDPILQHRWSCGEKVPQFFLSAVTGGFSGDADPAGVAGAGSPARRAGAFCAPL